MIFYLFNFRGAGENVIPISLISIFLNFSKKLDFPDDKIYEIDQ